MSHSTRTSQQVAPANSTIADLTPLSRRVGHRLPLLPWSIGLGIVCLVPQLFHLGGVEFCTDPISLDFDQLRSALPLAVDQQLHRYLSGSMVHTLLEWTAAIAAFFVAFLAFTHYRLTREPTLLVIGMALACAGMLDAFHILTANYLIRSAAPSDQLSPFTWGLCRFFHAFILLIGVAVCTLRPLQSIVRRNRTLILIGLAFAAVAVSTVVITASIKTIPQMTFANRLIKRPFDTIPLLIYVVLAVTLLPRYLKAHPTPFARSLLLSMIPQLATQLYMAFGSERIYDSSYNVGHVMKVLGYLVPLIGILMEYLAAADVERAAAAAAHAEAETRHETTINTIVDGLITIDEFGVIETINPAAIRMFGYADNEVIGQNVKILMPDPYRREHDGYLQHYRNTGEARIIGIGREVIGRRKDGTTFPIDLAVAEMRLGARRAFSGVVRDISGRKSIESQLAVKATDLERKNRELDQFAYTVSHDLKSPLVTLSGFADHLQRDLSANRLDRLEQFSRHIQHATIKMRRTIDDLLSISRVGRVTHPPTRFSIEHIVRRVLQLHAEQIARAEVLIDVSDKMPTVMTDAHAIEQVLDNLISNALKYGIDSPHPKISIGSMIENDEIRLFVRDNGGGIEPRFHEKIFGLFERLHRDQDGTGVGLALVARTMDTLNGRAWVESEPGKGATFWLSLPATIAAEPAGAEHIEGASK